VGCQLPESFGLAESGRATFDFLLGPECAKAAQRSQTTPRRK
jgi:hypothetical protein